MVSLYLLRDVVDCFVRRDALRCFAVGGVRSLSLTEAGLRGAGLDFGEGLRFGLGLGLVLVLGSGSGSGFGFGGGGDLFLLWGGGVPLRIFEAVPRSRLVADSSKEMPPPAVLLP